METRTRAIVGLVGLITPLFPTTVNAAVSTAPGSLPPAEVFRPRIPDLTQDNPLTRLFEAGLWVVGAFGTGVFIYGLYQGVALVLATMAGKKSRAEALQTLTTYGIAWGFLMLLLKGSIYAFLRLVFEFAASAAWR